VLHERNQTIALWYLSASNLPSPYQSFQSSNPLFSFQSIPSLSKQKLFVDMSPMRLGKKLHPAKKRLIATFKLILATFHSLIPSRRSKTSYVHATSKNKSAIRIDDLYSECVHAADKANGLEESSRSGKEMVGMVDSGDIDTIEDAWKIVVGKTPQLQVDERAEEFIKKFYEDVRLQKEKSLMEYQEMLARSA